MEEREGIASFNLNERFRGSDSNNGSGNNDGGCGGGGVGDSGGEGDNHDGGGAAAVPAPDGSQMALALTGEWMSDSAGSTFTHHIIHVSDGEDVAEKILSFALQTQRALWVISATGSVSTMTLSRLTASGGTVTYNDRFEILTLTGLYVPAETGGPRNRIGGVSILVRNDDGRVIGGVVGGKLIASTLVQVAVGSFAYGGGDGGKRKKMIEPRPSENEESYEVELK